MCFGNPGFNIIQSLTIPFQEILTLIFVYFIFSVLTAIIQNLYSYFNNQLNIILTYQMNYKLMEKCGELSLEKLEETETYEMINRLENEITIKPHQALNALIELFSSVVVFIIALLFLFQWRADLFFIFIVISAISFISHLKIAEKEFQMRFKRSTKERQAWYYSFLLTHDIAFKEIKILNLKNYFLSRYGLLINSFIELENGINRKQMIINLSLALLQDVASGLVMFLVMRETYLGFLLIGTAIFYMNMTAMVQNSSRSLATSLHSLYNSTLYMILLNDFLGIKIDENEGFEIIQDIEHLEVSNLSYSYSKGSPVLKNISFNINKGELVAIVGENGSGKSTLLKLLCGLYQPMEGNIKINGVDLSKVEQASYRQNVSVLFQDFLKFEASLLENIQIGDVEKEVKIEQIKKALYSADVNFLKNKDDYLYHDYLGNWFENGSQLFGGEWQKISLARAYYKEASMYMLDEPSSALDILAELKIFNHFFENRENKIGIFITHRVKMAKRADKIITLKNGEIISVGSHESLYKNCSIYKELLTKEQELDVNEIP